MILSVVGDAWTWSGYLGRSWIVLLIVSPKVLRALFSLGDGADPGDWTQGPRDVLGSSSPGCLLFLPMDQTFRISWFFLFPLKKKNLPWTKTFKGGRRAYGREDKNIHQVLTVDSYLWIVRIGIIFYFFFLLGFLNILQRALYTVKRFPLRWILLAFVYNTLLVLKVNQDTNIIFLTIRSPK